MACEHGQVNTSNQEFLHVHNMDSNIMHFIWLLGDFNELIFMKDTEEHLTYKIVQ